MKRSFNLEGISDVDDAGNGLTLTELEQIEESAHRSKTREAKTVLRLSAALREALQEKMNALAAVAELKRAGQPGSLPNSDPLKSERDEVAGATFSGKASTG